MFGGPVEFVPSFVKPDVIMFLVERWTVADKDGREIYLTRQEWENHILAHHPQLTGLLDDVLRTVRLGQRKQDRIRPNKYFYRHPCPRLPGHFTEIVVVVLFLPGNSYVVAAWPAK